jgi:hypothetical protein
MADFKSRDPAGPAFWDERFEQAFMPWDRAGTPAALQHFVASAPAPLTTLIPGCGLGHEVALLANAGWNVTAIDFSPAAVEAARKSLGPLGDHVVEADFFTFQPQTRLDLIYERAFFCALPPAMRESIVARWASLLPAGALLAGFFYFDATRSGPPFGIDPEGLKPCWRKNSNASKSARSTTLSRYLPVRSAGKSGVAFLEINIFLLMIKSRFTV